ncbi:kinesin-like protein KIF19 [Pseudophryne corroboree]|uniref:kinesin-like protein KIF19 n=1 Tax=Pseudophryne corroboree TaxID=495146 RepID=UPI003081AB91
MKTIENAIDHQMTVALRIRPFNMMETKNRAQCITHQLGPQTVLLKDPGEDPYDVLRSSRTRETTFTFNHVFDQAATQENVYDSTMKNIVDDILAGYNAAIFAYGPTGTGKTYTMMGKPREPGLMYLTLKDLFKTIEETGRRDNFSVSLSYAEIYNETIRDLLRPNSGSLALREDPYGNPKIVGITALSPSTPEEAMTMLKTGNKRRSETTTAANKTSSRSHAVLQVTVKQTGSDGVSTGRLYMVDLAGSERASQTTNSGKTMKEEGYINRSLLALRNCIMALRERPGSHINYRDSKLTWLLKGALSGKSRMVMIAHISPADSAYEDTRSTMTYGSKAKFINTRVERNNVPHGTAERGRGGNVLQNDSHPPEANHMTRAPSAKDMQFIMRRTMAPLNNLPRMVPLAKNLQSAHEISATARASANSYTFQELARRWL